MKKSFLFLLGVMFFASSCQDENMVIEESAVEENGVVLEPYILAFNQYEADEMDIPPSFKSGKKKLTKTIVFKRSSGTFMVVQNLDYCGGFTPSLQVLIEGSGIATHLGLITVVNLACVNQYSQFLTPVYGFITAASGSEIHTQMGTPYPDLDNPPNIYYPYTIIGGTEKYSDASGYFLMYGFTDYTTGLWNFTGEGEITY